MRDAQDNSELQIKQINELLKTGVDLLIVSPNEAAPITPIVEETFKNGTPVIIVDRKTNSELYSAYVGADNYEIGLTAGRYATQLLRGNGKIMEVWGLQGSSPAQERHRGFMDGIGAADSLRVTDTVYGQWLERVASKNIQERLKRTTAVDLVFAHNDFMALGAYEEFQAKGMAEGVRFFGVDGLSGNAGGMQLVADGILDATFLYPTGGEEAIQIALNILEKKPYDKQNILPTTIIDSSNVQILKQQTDQLLSQQEDLKELADKIKQHRRVYRNQRTTVYLLILALIVVAVLGALFAYNLNEKKRINRSLAAKNDEIINQKNQIEAIAEEAEKANRAKVEFFTNVSHEFRTPLTLIIGPVEDMIDNQQPEGQSLKNLRLIQKNAHRLLRLVNQLMDFRKIENNKMQIQAAENELVGFVYGVMNAFEQLAKKRQIDFRLITEIKRLPVWMDTDMMDKVLFNLLSNAFKFTDENGKIYLYIEVLKTEHKVKLVVEDNGRGMSKEHVEHAFERFYQGEQYQTRGTGLGLSLSKALVALHEGEISVTSEKGKGTRFEILLPLGKSHSAEAVTDTVFDQQRLPDWLEEEVGIYQATEKQFSEDGGQSILIIEDNEELRAFLKHKLGKRFPILEAANGLAGLEIAIEKVPDLIISDVKLPKINGNEVAKRLKSDLKTSHIPIILLTARKSNEAKLEGLRTGADAYLTKPFSIAILEEQINTILLNREILRQRFTNELNLSQVSSSSSPSTLDRKFINDFIAVVEANISDPSFNVQDICHELGLSRVQAYRKLKSLLGYSMSDYVKEVRLKKARQLLLESDQSISEVAYAVGFSSPGYFSTAFKNHYGQSPSDFKNQLQP